MPVTMPAFSFTGWPCADPAVGISSNPHSSRNTRRNVTALSSWWQRLDASHPVVPGNRGKVPSVYSPNFDRLIWRSGLRYEVLEERDVEASRRERQRDKYVYRLRAGCKTCCDFGRR